MSSPLKRLLGRALGAALDPTIALSYDRTGYRVHRMTFVEGDLDVDMSGRSCAVTGANSGIGFETARGLAERGARTFLLCRSPERGEAARDRLRRETGNPEVHLTRVDLSVMAQVRAAADALKGETLDVLIHNAGVLPDGRETTADGLELTYATNLVGPHLLTRLLAPHMAPGGRILNVSSGGMYTQRLHLPTLRGETDDFDGVVAYAQTKRAMVILTEMLAESLAPLGLTVNAMHPGWADTPAVESSLPRFHAVTKALLRTPAEGADTLLWLALCERIAGETGGFYFDREARRTHYLPTTRTRPGDRARLWAQVEADSGAAEQAPPLAMPSET